jgi:hypothetical protein
LEDKGATTNATPTGRSSAWHALAGYDAFFHARNFPLHASFCPHAVPHGGIFPQHDSGRHQVEAAGPVTLLLKTAVADFAQTVEEHGTRQCITRLALVQSGMHTAAQFDTLQPVQDEQCALNATKFAQGNSQTILARVLRFSQMVLEILFSIAYNPNEFR